MKLLNPELYEDSVSPGVFNYIQALEKLAIKAENGVTLDSAIREVEEVVEALEE